MTDEGTRQPLGEYLGMEAIGPLLEKRLFGAYNVRYLPFLWAGFWVFLKGIALGRARHDRMQLLAKMLAEPGRGTTFYDAIPQMANKLASDYGTEVQSFYDLWIATLAPRENDYFDIDTLRRLYRQKVRLGDMLPWLTMWLAYGVCFGATYAEMTERIWRQEFEKVDPESWQKARAAGLDIPERFTPLALEEMQHVVLLAVADYAREYFPELVEPLGLDLA